MQFILTLKLALVGIFTNKVRSFLTILGIVIGIAAVIALLSLGEGAQIQISGSISSLGSNLMTIFPGTSIRSVPGTNTEVSLTERDYEYLNNQVRFPNVKLVSPFVRLYTQASKSNLDSEIDIQGVNEIFPEIQDFKVASGSFFSEADVDSSTNVIVLGKSVVSDLFPGDSAEEVLGQSVYIKQQSFKVIGVMPERGSSGFNNLDDNVYIPYSTVTNKLANSDKLTSIYVSVKDLDLVDTTVVQVEEKLAEFRGRPGDQDFTVFTSDDILSTASTVTSIFTTLLSSIAGISLLVGGIGISNIMLVSVTERTKEIGLRKAIGAQQSDILLQFLLEAGVLTLLGGILGIALGVSLALGIGKVTGIPANLSIPAILMATTSSALIGIIFGFYPAYRAAKLDPIVALRYE